MSIIYSDYVLGELRKHCLFLFDLDLTLVKTEWSYTLAVLRQVIKNCGGRIFPASDLMEDFWIGNSMPRDDYIKHVLKLKPKDFWREYHQLDVPEARAAKTVVMPFVLENLRQLKSQGKLIGVVTAAYPDLASAELALIDFQFDSTLSVSLHPELRPKPEPDGLLWSMSQLGCSREETIYIGDSFEDYLSAGAAGIRFIHHQYEDRCLPFGQSRQPFVMFDKWANSPFLQM